MQTQNENLRRGKIKNQPA